MWHTSWNPYPISDQNLWFSLPYFRPEALEPGAWPERVTSCYGTYTVVGVNIKREMVLSPNDEEVASSKKHTQFKTRVHKPYPISDQTGRNWYPISDQTAKKTIPLGAAHTYIAYISKISMLRSRVYLGFIFGHDWNDVPCKLLFSSWMTKSCHGLLEALKWHSITHSLTHSHTHSILINSFIKVRLNTLLLPPLLSITFVPSVFYACV